MNEDRVIELEQEKADLNGKIDEMKAKLTNPEDDRLSIEQFLNLSKNAGVIVQSADAIIKDKICREIFLNFTIKDKILASYQLNQPFDRFIKDAKIPSSRGGEN